MRLVLPIPEGTPSRELDGGRTLYVLEGTVDAPAVSITVHHPRVVPMSLLEWANLTTRCDLPDGALLETVSSRVDHSKLGWLMQVVHEAVTTRGASAPSEFRLTAMFQLNPFRTLPAAAMARVAPERFDELKPRIQAMFEEARPDWTGPDIAALVQLYE